MRAVTNPPPSATTASINGNPLPQAPKTTANFTLKYTQPVGRGDFYVLTDPGTMLTSMVKRVDLAVLSAFKGVKPGITSLGLKEGGLDYAMDEFNAKLVTAEMKQRVEAARADIVSGKLRVIDYTAANACR
jgi:basic membrane lipoprotein Med (substrate-binding protein (PBP1-ABC) superfamily)